MEKFRYLVIIIAVIFLNNDAHSRKTNSDKKELAELAKIINLDWSMNLDEILNYFPSSAYKETDANARISGYCIVPIKLFDKNSKAIFYDFDSNRAMRRIYVEINNEDKASEMLKEIVNFIYDNYNKYLILSEGKTNTENSEYNLQIYNFFNKEKGLDIRISQIESITGSRHLQIILIPVIHSEGFSEEEIKEMLKSINYEKHKLKDK